MLASLRNRNPSFSATLCGFYFPLSKECVIEVGVQWSDKQMRFIGTQSCLLRTEVNSRLNAVYERNVVYWNSSSWTNDGEGHSYPMTPKYVADLVKYLDLDQKEKNHLLQCFRKNLLERFPTTRN